MTRPAQIGDSQNRKQTAAGARSAAVVAGLAAAVCAAASAAVVPIRAQGTTADDAGGNPVGYPLYMTTQTFGSYEGMSAPTIAADGSYYTYFDYPDPDPGVLSLDYALARLAPDGSFSILHTFTGDPTGTGTAADGNYLKNLLAAADGSVYGSAEGGANGYGVVFKYTADGQFSVVHDFTLNEGGTPNCLVQAADGTFYGTNSSTVFKLGADGSVTTLYTFPISQTAGEAETGCLTIGNDGNLYGVGPVYKKPLLKSQVPYGGVFRLTPDGTLTVLREYYLTTYFPTTNPLTYGDMNASNLVLAPNGNLYGIETHVQGRKSVFKLFKVSPAGFYGNVATVSGLAGTGNPDTFTLFAGADGKLYGESAAMPGLFSLSTSGTLTTPLYHFAVNTTNQKFSAGATAAAWADGFGGPMTLDGDGNLVVTSRGAPAGYPGSIGGDQPIDFVKIQLAGDMTVTAGFDNPTVAAGTTVTLTWNTTGAASCLFYGDVPDASLLNAQPVSGSLSFAAHGSGVNWNAFGLECLDAQNGITRVPLSLNVTS